MHGLPHGQVGAPVTWEQLVEHLRALAECGLPIRVWISDERTRRDPYLETRGYLRWGSEPQASEAAADKPGVALTLHSAEAAAETGRVAVYSHLFTKGILFTDDGDTFFTLQVWMGNVVVFFREGH